MILKTDENLGYHSEKEINNFTHQDCNDYLNCHTKEELSNMSLLEKMNLIKELEYNFQKQ